MLQSLSMNLCYRGSRYEVLDTLGEGGSGIVYRARDLLEKRIVALKVFSPQERDAASLLAGSEFRILASQSHPGVVRVYDYGTTDDGYCYFSMELLEGRDLLTFARDTATDPEALAESPLFSTVIRQVLTALDYVHTCGLLHLDLKPSNILVTTGADDTPQAKLIDFGFARGPAHSTQTISGTVEYLAPERLRDEPPDTRTDLYSVGITLYELLAGHCPFRGATAGEVIRDHLKSAVPEVEKLPLRYRDTVLRLLEKQPAKRPPSAWSVLLGLFDSPRDEASEIGDRGTQALAALPAFGTAFVGRTAPLRQLEAAVRSAAANKPQSILLHGAVGVGKTRLLRELEVRLQLDGVAAGIEFSRETTRRPGELLSKLLRRATLDSDGTHRDLEADIAALGRSTTPDGLEEADSVIQREHLLQRFIECLFSLAEKRSIVFLVDDLHRVDTFSREGLVWLLRAIEHRGNARLCLILGCRDEEEDNLQVVQEITQAGSGFSSFSTLHLEGLNEGEIQRYLGQVLGAGPSTPELVRAFAAETGGNVFFIEEYLKLLVRSGRMRRSGVLWEVPYTPGEKFDVPRIVDEAISHRLVRIEGAVRDVLEWAAVIDAPLTARELAEYTSLPGVEHAPPAEVAESLLSELVLEQFLRREGTLYFFAHEAARGVVYDAIDEADRRRRHGDVAKRFLTGKTDTDFEHLEEIAHHLFHSDEPFRAGSYLLRAGERARKAGAFREAALHYTRALEVSDSERSHFEILLGRQEILGHLGRKEDQREDLDALKQAALGDPRREREAKLREALFLESLGRKRDALDRLVEATAKSSGEPALEARLHSKAGMLQFYLSDFAGGFESIRLALEYAGKASDRTLEAECRQIAGFGHYFRADYDQALAEMNRALLIRREGGDETRIGSLSSNLGLIYYDRGDLEAAEERFLDSLKVFRRIGFRRGEAVNLLNLGLVYLDMGRHERALDSFHGSLCIRRELGDRRAEGADLGNLASAWMQVGRLERAVPLLEDALSLAREFENLQSESANECRLGEVDLERGHGEKALERFTRGLAIAETAGLPAQVIVARRGLARTHQVLEAPVKAREQAEAALKLADSRNMQRQRIGCRVLLASSFLEDGKLDAADRCSRQAVEELERVSGWVADAHLVWFARYRILEALGHKSDEQSDAECEGALRRAYVLLREKSDAFQDDELRQGYLENIPFHRKINQLHEVLQTRIRREATLRERSFHEIAKSIHSIVEIDPLLDHLLALAIETTHAEKGLIALKNSGGNFTIRAARGMAKESVEDATDICKSVIADVTRGGQPILAADAGSDDRFRDRRSIISFRIQTLMCAPMKARDEVIGAVYVDGRGASSFDQEDLEYVVSFSQLAAIAVENARLLERLRTENIYLRREVERRYRFENLLGESPAMERLTHLMEKVADTPASILIWGETGTGKEVVARSVHYASDRRSRPFVTVDCGALPENLLESELFGHRRGAFSGAIHDRVGLFEEAGGGTLFLDEITNTSTDLQAKLLRVLQEGEIRRVGENQVRKVDVRIIAATNIDMAEAVKEGTFREDLYYRLSVIPLEVPPLRERREDIPLLALHFLKKTCERHSKEIEGFTEAGMAFLVQAPWRGNVRELENLIEKAVILAEKDMLDALFLEELQPSWGSRDKPASAEGPEQKTDAGEVVPARTAGAHPIQEVDELSKLSLEEFDQRWLEAEKGYLERVVTDAGGNLAEAARRARVRNRNTLISRLKRHGIKAKRKES